MKNIPILLIVAGTALLCSCENPILQETKVHEDGSLDKTITFENDDSLSRKEADYFHLSEDQGWNLQVEKMPFEKKREKDMYRIAFSRSFPSADAMNEALDAQSDTLFSVRAAFEKSFRWFYTYIRYSETYRPINRFKHLPYTDFFNAEDLQFIDRLPAEGAPVSKADSVSLQMLSVKVDDYYTRAAITNEQLEIFNQLLRLTGTRPSLLDSAESLRELMYELLEGDKNDNRFAMRVADSIGIRFPDRGRAQELADSLSADFNARLGFMSFARDGKYRAVIEMPWSLVSTNADSVAGNQLFWRPLPHKFMFKDYTLYAESRQLNPYVTVISVVVMVLSLIVVVRKLRS